MLSFSNRLLPVHFLSPIFLSVHIHFLFALPQRLHSQMMQIWREASSSPCSLTALIVYVSVSARFGLSLVYLVLKQTTPYMFIFLRGSAFYLRCYLVAA